MVKSFDQTIDERIKVMRAVLAGESFSERAAHFRLWAESLDALSAIGEWLLRMAEALEGIE